MKISIYWISMFTHLRVLYKGYLKTIFCPFELKHKQTKTQIKLISDPFISIVTMRWKETFWAYWQYFLPSGVSWWRLVCLLKYIQHKTFCLGRREGRKQCLYWTLRFVTTSSDSQNLFLYKPQENMLVVDTSKCLFYSVYNQISMLRHFYHVSLKHMAFLHNTYCNS